MSGGWRKRVIIHTEDMCTLSSENIIHHYCAFLFDVKALGCIDTQSLADTSCIASLIGHHMARFHAVARNLIEECDARALLGEGRAEQATLVALRRFVETHIPYAIDDCKGAVALLERNEAFYIAAHALAATHCCKDTSELFEVQYNECVAVMARQ